MSEFEPTLPIPDDEKPATRKVGEKVMKITYLPPVDPETVREHDSVDREYPGRSPRAQAYAYTANANARRKNYRRRQS